MAEGACEAACPFSICTSTFHTAVMGVLCSLPAATISAWSSLPLKRSHAYGCLVHALSLHDNQLFQVLVKSLPVQLQKTYQVWVLSASLFSLHVSRKQARLRMDDLPVAHTAKQGG